MDEIKKVISFIFFGVATFLITVGFPMLFALGCKEKGAFSCEEEYPATDDIAALLAAGAVVFLLASVINLLIPYKRETRFMTGSVSDSSIPKTHENYWNEDRYK
jgi:hypothetical protein